MNSITLKLRTLVQQKDIKGVKRQTVLQEKTFAIHVISKGFVSRINKYYKPVIDRQCKMKSGL